MFTVQLTETFQAWLLAMRDMVGRAAIARRLDRMALGNFGDAKPLGNGLSELRIDAGPGYRVYFTVQGQQIVVVLAGGDKSTQQRDIVNAQAKLAESKEKPTKGGKKKE
jgi:putative addiction module killer protein